MGVPMWYRMARHSTEVVGWVFHADVYCAGCGDTLPDVDPEGNDKHPIFLDEIHIADEYSCGGCGESCSDW